MLSRLVWYVQRLFGATYGKLSIDEARRLADGTGVFFVDVNPPDRYAQGHIPGAKNAPDEVGANDLPSDRNATLVFYCGSPM